MSNTPNATNETATSATPLRDTILGLQFVFIHTDDMAATRAFYAEQMGLTLVTDSPDFLQFAAPGGKGAELGVGLGAAESGHEPELWWYVNDVDAAYAALIAQGAEIVTPLTAMPFGRTFATKDPAGYTLNLLQLA